MPAATRHAISALLIVQCFVLSGPALANGDAGSATAHPTVYPGTSSPGVVAQAGSIVMSGADVRTLVAALPPSERAVAASNLDSLEQVVHADLVRRAVLRDAKSSSFDQQADVLAALNQVSDETLVRLWIAKQAALPASFPSEAEIQSAYSANRQALTAPALYHLQQIFIAAPDGGDSTKLRAALQKADVIAVKIQKEDFGTVASQQSEDTASAAHGGDLGYLPENRILPDVLAVVRTAKAGEVIGPIKTAQGLRFLKLVDTKAGVVPTLAQAHDALVAALRRQRAAQLEQAYLKEYSAKLGVAVNQIELAKLQSSLPR